MLALAGFVIVATLLIFVHELGHYWAAKAVGMRVDAFSIGFGKPILRWKRGETEWRLGWLPLGGYVAIAGMDQKKGVLPTSRDFGAKSVSARAFVVAAGVLMNLLTALLCFTLAFTVAPDAIGPHQGHSRAVATVEAGVRLTGDVTTLTAKGINVLAHGKAKATDISGPVSVARMSADALREGTASFLAFLGVISINLFVFNLLPVLPLDGGGLVLLLYEKVRGRPASRRAELIFGLIGLTLVVLLSVWALGADLWKLFH